MNEIPPHDSARLLKQFGLRAYKGLGQNFLEDPAALENIARAADAHDSDSVLEIGPGLGALTRHLSRMARQVVAVELDSKLVAALRTILSAYPNVRLVEGDILDFAPGDLGLPEGYIVAANIPYNITSAILRHLLESKPEPRRIVLTVQKEVAQRVCASPPDMSILSLSVQVYGAPSIVAAIPAEAFHPQPKVDSAVVRIEVYRQPAIRANLLPAFFRLVKAGFAQKRKTLRNALAAGTGTPPAQAQAALEQAGLDPKRRAETLSLDEWQRLCEVWERRPVGSSKELL